MEITLLWNKSLKISINISINICTIAFLGEFEELLSEFLIALL